MSARRRPDLRLAWLVVIALVVAVAAHVLISFLTADRMIRDEMSLIRAKGQPTSWGEIGLLVPSTPATREASRLRDEAFVLLRSLPAPPDSRLVLIEGSAVVQYGAPIPPAVFEATKTRVRDAEPVLDNLRAAAEAGPPSARLDLGGGGAGYTPTSSLADARACAQLLAMSALIHAADGDGDRAVDDAITGLKFARMLDSEPTVVGCLVRVACTAIAVAVLENVIAASDPKPEVFDRLDDVLSEDARFDASHFLIGERVLDVGWLESLSLPELLVHASKGGLLRSLLREPAIVRFANAGCLRMYRRLLDIWHLPWSEFQHRVAAIPVSLGGASMWEDRFEIMSSLKQREAEIRGRVRCARVGVAVERFRRRESRLPDRLEELVPADIEEIPEDPFTGNSLRLDRKDGGFEVYAEHPEPPPPTWDRRYRCSFRILPTH